VAPQDALCSTALKPTKLLVIPCFMESFRRQREEELDKQYGAPPTETYTSTTVITKSVECHEEHNGDEDTTVVTESTEVVEEEYMEVIFWLTFTDVCHNIH